jgi:cell division septum initiation protein DivIVA
MNAIVTPVPVSQTARELGQQIDVLLGQVAEEHSLEKRRRATVREHEAVMQARHTSEERVKRLIKRAGVPKGCSFARGGYQFVVAEDGAVLYQRAPEPLEDALRDAFGAPDLGSSD